MTDERLVPVIMPPLVLLLQHHEREKGAPLTEQEVIEIRDSAPAIAMTASDARALAAGRGFDDISPEDAWNEWQAARLTLDQEARGEF